MQVIFGDLLKSESGVTEIEYAFIAILIAIAIVSALTTIGAGLSTKFEAIASNL